MKTSINCTIFIIALLIPFSGYSQEGIGSALSYEIFRVYPSYTITRDELHNAKKLVDLYKYYDHSWVNEYKSVEIVAINDGKVVKAIGEDNNITQKQMDIMRSSDNATEIEVTVHYIPDNTLPDKEVKKNNFTFSIDPDNDAIYEGGEAALKHYLKANAIDKLPSGSFDGFDLVAVNFTINEEGEIANAHVYESMYQTYENDEVGKLLIEAVQNMPCWNPAEFIDGTKVKQHFVLAVGNHQSCVMNLLGIRNLHN